MKQEIDPTKIKKIIDLAIAILSAIGGFFSGIATKIATTFLIN